MSQKIAAGILGCTGVVGQKFIALLEHHPWFKITELAASERSAGKNYAEQVKWHEATPIPKDISHLPIKKCTDQLNAKILFSGLDSSVAGEIEIHYAKQGHCIISNSKNHRMNADIPLVIPEINSGHFELIKQQPSFKSGGCIVTNPNCSAIVLALALYPIYRKFELTKIIAATMQAISGAGYPGIPALDILGNVIPHIEDEEEKIQTELLKIYGEHENGQITLADCQISAMCNRVPVYNGHTIAISFATKNKAAKEELISTYQNYPRLNLPSSPAEVVRYLDDVSRPQPALDINTGNGMTVSIGNLRPCNILNWKLTAFGHNTIRGAAGAAILNAEYLVREKLI
jgi:aspartate-semialdehyde dehydrogenase